MEFIGKTIAKRYHIIEQLGGGGMALVYKAMCNTLQREVTIKILRPQFTSDESFVERFRREAQAVARLSHPNIVNVYDVGEEDNIYYIVMEYIDGCNLKEIIKERGTLKIKEAIDIGIQICEGIQHAHDNDIVHRDVKPHNILVTKKGRVKVTDFGIARATSASTVTQTGTIVGSVHYISPEQAKGEMVGVSSDIYQVGIVLYEMLTGRAPFEGDSPIAVAMKHISNDPVPPKELNPEIPELLEHIILKAIAKNPAQRYKKAEDLSYDLKRVDSGERLIIERPILDPDEMPTQTLRVDEIKTEVKEETKPEKNKASNRNRWLILMLVLVGILGGVVVATSGLLGPKVVNVPDLVGNTVLEAERTLTPMNLTLKVIDEQFNEAEEGEIISQIPEADKQVKEGRTIEVIVSKGQELVEVPDVEGQTEIEAEFDLEYAKLEVGEVEEEFSSKVPKGEVIEQIPRAGEKTAVGTKVTLIISKGPEPRYVSLPSLVGLTLSEAKNKLSQSNLVLEEPVGEEESTEYLPGIVVRQEPAVGNGQLQVEEGSRVKVWLSKGPGPEPREINLRLELPDDGEVHKVRVVVKDALNPEGREEVVKDFFGGEKPLIPVKVYVKGTVLTYLNEELIDEHEVN